ncbi:hypothetical protein, partial [Klebsiella pneumoniae]|uniref:hypothetical protein n=1 Tax=Klebsiella pneumoniae TaxID=573 RepID=UPI00125B993B
KACVLPENPASYRVVRTKSYLFNKAHKVINGAIPFPNFRSSLKSDLHPSQIAHVVSKRK